MSDKTGKWIYQKQIEDLIAKIKEVIKDTNQSKVDKSNVIMKRLRDESIRFPLEYINNSFYTKDRKATLDPSEILDTSYEGDSIEIKGNSFGPFNPKEYFNKKKGFRILWLLKEPFINYASWLNGDRGKHDQAYEYYHEVGWNGINYGKDRNPTIANLINISKKILKAIGVSFINVNEEEIMKQVMDHICILEINHFPGLAFQSTKSNDDVIGEWAEINSGLLDVLVTFYQPQLVIGPRVTLNNLVTTYEKNEGERYTLYDEKNGKIYREFFNWARKNTLDKWTNARHFIPCPIEEISNLDKEINYLPKEIRKIYNKNIISKNYEKINYEAIEEIINEETTNGKNRDWEYVSAAKTFMLVENKMDKIWWIAAYHPSYYIMTFDHVIEELCSFIKKIVSDDECN